MINEEQPHYRLRLYYPYNDRRTYEAIRGLLNNLDRIKIEDIEKLIEE